MFQLRNFSDCVDFCDIALTRGPGLAAEALGALQRSLDLQW